MDPIEKLRTYFDCQSTFENTFNKFNSIHNVILNIHKKSVCQAMIKDIFNFNAYLQTHKLFKIRNL